MKSLIIILLYFVFEGVSVQINDHNQDRISSKVYNQSQVHVMQNDRHHSEYYGYERSCLDAEDISPCVCTYYSASNAMDLECSTVEREKQLKQIFKADFPFKNFREFHIQGNNNLKVLEAGIFNGISFESINICNNNLEVIESQAFDSCYEVATAIFLKANRITSFPFDELSRFSKLSHFDIFSNSLSVIPANAFNGLTALDYLDISDNYAKIVGTFQDLPSLHIIDLGYNDISIVPANFIKTGSSDLTYIYMWGNNIVSVEPGAFDIVDGLYAMEDNLLSTLEEATWRPYLEVGGKLFAARNPLICD
ncbi:unnamed protein product [Meganyctiphanes norvegica]|uniref:Oplophorus-luciferin 2-monooxygenase non-catalytic subunit n=1 Tax=Meganyctiphanes norvegica TaxID=48144 RepID=A0AAV2QSH1_MEGNR